VAQEVLIRAPGDAPLGWLYAVCYRIAIDRLRARKRRDKALSALALRPANLQGDIPLEVEAVRARLGELADPYRSAVTLRYLEELDYPEIAKRLGTIERTARTWVARGLEKLRKALTDAG